MKSPSIWFLSGHSFAGFWRRGPAFAISTWLVASTVLFSSLSVVADDFFNQIETASILSFGPWPPARIPNDPGNELSGLVWAEQLGEHLFNDKSMSGDGSIACSSCHDADLGFADAKTVAVGAKQHVRNTQGLLNTGLQRWFGWDGGTDSLWAASLRPLLSPIEMNGELSELAARLRNNKVFIEAINKSEFNWPETDEALLVFASKAIAAYSRTLVSGITRFDRYRESIEKGDEVAMAQYSPGAKRGLKIFVGQANCHVCHFGPTFSNGEFHDTGRPFFIQPGQVDAGRYTGIKRVRQDPYNLLGMYNGTGIASEIRKVRTVKLGQVNWGQWRTPGLRNLQLTGPYMHDGSLQTLRQVVDAYADIDPARLHSQGESILKPLDLSEGERNDLVEFLETLSEQRTSD